MTGHVGIGLQVNPTVLELQPQGVDDSLFEYAELLCDNVAGPLDAGYVIDPFVRPLLEEISAKHPLIAHGNYGNEFGFEPLDETVGVLRHIAAAHAMNSPWYLSPLVAGQRRPVEAGRLRRQNIRHEVRVFRGISRYQVSSS